MGETPPDKAALLKAIKGAYLEYRPKKSGYKETPSKIQYVRKMVSEMTPVVVYNQNSYPSFWKIFKLHCAEKKKSLKLYSRQIAEDAWLLIPQDAADAPPPRFLINEIAHTRWGRYKMYAARLEAGETLSLTKMKRIGQKSLGSGTGSESTEQSVKSLRPARKCFFRYRS